MKNFVYITTNKNNGKQYIGSHNGSNKYYIGGGLLIKKAIKKYGRNEFHHQILERFDTIEEARKKEEFYINKFNTIHPYGYNISPIGGLCVNGCHSEETKKKIGNALRNKRRTDKQKSLMSRRAKERKIHGRQLYFSELEKFTIIRLHLMMKQSSSSIANFLNINKGRIERFLKSNGIYQSHPNRSIQRNYLNLVLYKIQSL